MTTAMIEDLDTMPLGEIQARITDVGRMFSAARQAGDVESMRTHYSAMRELAGARDALLASAAQSAPVASAPPSIQTVVMPSAMVSTDEPRDSRPTDDGWSPRCGACRQSYHDKKIRMVAVRASGIVIKICPSCRKRHPGLAPA